MCSPERRPSWPLALAGSFLMATTLLACGGGGGGAGGGDTADGMLPEEPAASSPAPILGPPAGQPPSGAQACAPWAGLVEVRTGDFQAFLSSSPIVSAPASREDAEGFRAPGTRELQTFETLFGALLRGAPTPDVTSGLGTLGFRLSCFEDGQRQRGWLVLEESAPRWGRGTYAISLSPSRELWLEAPHAYSDEGTLEQSVEQLVTLDARALIITGSHRCASPTQTSCDGNTKVCGGRLRNSDAAHSTELYFHAAHRALRAQHPSAVAVSVHGMESEGSEAAVVSDGTSRLRDSSVSVRFRDALNSQLPGSERAYSCNATSDKGKFRALCGTTNVQGRHDNRVPDACRAGAPGATDLFLHLEQGKALRHDAKMRERVARALSTLAPGP